jgi:hypothetical protein
VRSLTQAAEKAVQKGGKIYSEAVLETAKAKIGLPLLLKGQDAVLSRQSLLLLAETAIALHAHGGSSSLVPLASSRGDFNVVKVRWEFFPGCELGENCVAAFYRPLNGGPDQIILARRFVNPLKTALEIFLTLIHEGTHAIDPAVQLDGEARPIWDRWSYRQRLLEIRAYGAGRAMLELLARHVGPGFSGTYHHARTTPYLLKCKKEWAGLEDALLFALGMAREVVQ